MPSPQANRKLDSILPLRLNSLSFSYGRKGVLREFSLAVAPGEVVVLIGANGAGKSTLFSILAGLQAPHRGEIWFGDAQVDELAESIRGRLAYLSHAPQLYPRLTATENLEFFGELWRSAGMAPKVDGQKLLQSLGLPVDVYDDPISTYSRGMVQRVALARVLCQCADLFLLDEPFTALDQVGISSLIDEIESRKAEGAGFLLASHDPAVVARVADRVLLMVQGRVTLEATRDEHEPASFAKHVAEIALMVHGGRSD